MKTQFHEDRATLNTLLNQTARKIKLNGRKATIIGVGQEKAKIVNGVEFAMFEWPAVVRSLMNKEYDFKS